jgi:predicted DNA-binding transcriptional regulator YafY
VGVRTVRRDVERLRALGYEVRSAAGVGGGYRLVAGAAMAPLLLDDEEAVAVAVALRGAASAGVAGIEETSLRALAKLEQVLPVRVRRRVGAVAAATVAHRVAGPTVDQEVLAVIAAACRDHERLRFRYRRHDGSVARRAVEPHRLVHTGRRWYLVAWDAGREDWRTFRVDRIEPTPAPDRRFVPRRPPAGDLAAYVARGVSSARDRYEARVVLGVPLERAAARVPAWVGTLEPIDAEHCLLVAGSDWLGGLAIHIAELGFEFRVIEPPELAVRVRELAERFARALSGEADSRYPRPA